MPPRQSKAEILDRENQAVDLRRNGATYRQIAERMSITEAGAHGMVQRALTRHQAESVPDLRRLEVERLDQLQVAALRILQRPQPVIRGGKVVYDANGEPLREVDPYLTLAATDRLLKIQERRARLLGLDAPTKVDMKVFTVDQMDARIEELQALLAVNDQPASEHA